MTQPMNSANRMAIGIDCGTSGVRAVAVNSCQQILAESALALTEQTPAHWWKTTLSVLDDLFSQLHQTVVLASYQVAISLDATSSSLFLISRDGIPLTPVLMYYDACSNMASAIRSQLGSNSGAQGAQSSLAKALTLADSLAKQIPHDTVLHQWEKATLELIGQAHLPKVVAPATLIGDLKEALRERWQLPTSTQLASGTTDSIAAFLATGASMPGDAVISLGSTLAFKLLTHQPYFDAEKGIYSHRLWNQWLVGGASNAGGACLLQAFELSQLQLLAQQSLVQPSPVPDYYPLPSQRCGERFPVNDPHLCAPSLPHTLDASERFSTLVHGLVAIEQLGWQRLSEGCEQPITRLYACGGGNKNPAWAGLRKATLTMPHAHPLSEQAAVGAAMLALRSLSNMTSV
ncbi:MAG TPA: FGGY family carbohydrate kinase [Thiotrichales bacterium]|nr:FGGY family carbohydrate kinase [Thiotrichales bacterium]